MIDISNYDLIGIGEFSHGIEESWIFRIDLIKHFLKTTNKHITIFNEQSVWQAENIMNNTYYDRETNSFIKKKGIKKEKEYITKEGYVGGTLWQYCSHSLESKIFLKFIYFIRKNKRRITLIGVDNDTLDRDNNMAQIILNKINKEHINLFFAHNDHISTAPLHKYNMNPGYYCGYYLKQKLKYCIILSQTYKGENRFNGYCLGDNCETRTWQLKYFYKKFIIPNNRKYVNKKHNWQLLDKFESPFIGFSNSYFKNNTFGESSLEPIKEWNYVLFWNKVTRLIPL